MLVLELLAACEKAYDSPIYVSPDGRDAFYYAKTDKYQIIAPRGTVTEGLVAISDWYNDFHAERIHDPLFTGRVHEGFASSFHAIWDKVSIKGKLPLFITGHSKGGAIAQLMAWTFRKLNPITVTFGSPKVGDQEFATALGWQPIFRYENVFDIVPKLPVVGYTSAGVQIVSPRTFTGRWEYHENHSLETGYKPWIKEMLCAAQSASSSASSS